MRTVFLLLCTLTLLSAYQKGDRLDKEMVQKLHLETKKIYIIDFFASWCKSCKREMPLIAKLHRTLPKEQVEIIGIDVDEDTHSGLKFQQKLKEAGNLPFQVINDPKGEIIGRFAPVGTPAIYIVKDQTVVGMEIGAKNNIDTLLQHTIEGLQ